MFALRILAIAWSIVWLIHPLVLLWGADPVRLEPAWLRGGDHGVGTLIPDAKLHDLSGNAIDLVPLVKNHRAVVIAMTSTSCPVSKKYLPTLVALSLKYAEQNVRFVLVNSVATDSLTDMQQTQVQLGENAIYSHDPTGQFANQVGAMTTTDAFVLDSDRTITYHGAIDDQYGFGFSRAAARSHFLADALNAVLSNHRPMIEATEAPGCQLATKDQPFDPTAVTYHRRVCRLMNRHCVPCHRDSGVGPFRLDTFADVVSHAAMIREVIDRGVMPPWFAANEDQSQISPWSNDASLTPMEKRDLLAWIDAGQSEGAITDAADPLRFESRWKIGKPDAVFELPRAIPIQATGVMPYQHMTLETNLTEDKWVQQIEILPSEPSVVHHVLVYAIAPGDRITKPIDYWAVYVPGNGAHSYPVGYARRLKKGSRLHFQMHYTPNGTATKDKTQIGIRYAEHPPTHEVQTASIVNNRFSIPPRAARHQVQAELRVPRDVQILGFLPHHHLRGVAARYELVGTSGSTEMLLDVPDYDFNWQLFYQYARPPIFNKGMTIRYSGWYDNSENNPANPDPNQTVHWGQQTEDEMHVGYVEYAEAVHRRHSEISTELSAKPILSFTELDIDGDLELSLDELVKLIPDRTAAQFSPEQFQKSFSLLDKDHSGGLSEQEFELVRRRFAR